VPEAKRTAAEAGVRTVLNPDGSHAVYMNDKLVVARLHGSVIVNDQVVHSGGTTTRTTVAVAAPSVSMTPAPKPRVAKKPSRKPVVILSGNNSTTVTDLPKGLVIRTDKNTSFVMQRDTAGRYGVVTEAKQYDVLYNGSQTVQFLHCGTQHMLSKGGQLLGVQGSNVSQTKGAVSSSFGGGFHSTTMGSFRGRSFTNVKFFGY
jgi:hypothetical protein